MSQPDVMGRLTTGDRWIHHFYPATKQESMRWKSPHFPVKMKVYWAKSMNKVILILFFDVRGAVYWHIVPRHMTLSVLYYCEVLRTLKRHMNKKRHSLKKIWLLHHNTKPHTISIVRKLLKKGKIEVLTHPTYNTDLALCNFWIFGALKQELWNRGLRVVCRIGDCSKPLLSRPSSRRIP